MEAIVHDSKAPNDNYFYLAVSGMKFTVLFLQVLYCTVLYCKLETLSNLLLLITVINLSWSSLIKHCSSVELKVVQPYPISTPTPNLKYPRHHLTCSICEINAILRHTFLTFPSILTLFSPVWGMPSWSMMRDSNPLVRLATTV